MPYGLTVLVGVVWVALQLLLAYVPPPSAAGVATLHDVINGLGVALFWLCFASAAYWWLS